MKKYLLPLLLLSCSLILSNGCASRPSDSSAARTEPLTQTLPAAQLESEDGSDTNNIDQSANPEFEKIKALLQTYPGEYTEILKQDNFFIHTFEGPVRGQLRWDEFLRNTEAGQKDSIVLVQFTVEGDPIYYYLSFEGDSYYLVTDNSRDAYKAADSDDYNETSLPYLKEFERTIPNPVSGEGSLKTKTAYLVSDPAMTYEDIQDVLLSSQAPDGRISFQMLYYDEIDAEDSEAPFSLIVLESAPGGLEYVISPCRSGLSGEWFTGTPYRLEVQTDDGWKNVPVVKENTGWEDLALIIHADRETGLTENWDYLYGSLEKGFYRISKEINCRSENGELKKFSVSGTFYIN